MQTEQPQPIRGNQMANNKHGWGSEPGTTENTAVGWSGTRTQDRRQSYLAQDSGRYQALTQVKKKQGNTSWLPGICSHRKTVLLSVNIPPHLVTPPDKWSHKIKRKLRYITYEVETDRITTVTVIISPYICLAVAVKKIRSKVWPLKCQGYWAVSVFEVVQSAGSTFWVQIWNLQLGSLKVFLFTCLMLYMYCFDILTAETLEWLVLFCGSVCMLMHWNMPTVTVTRLSYLFVQFV